MPLRAVGELGAKFDLRFRLRSDHSVVQQGVHIDMIQLLAPRDR